MRAAVEQEHPPLARDRRLGGEAVDPQLADIDVDVGQQRPFLGRRLEYGGAAQHHALRGQRTQVDVVAEIGERPPVDLDLGREQELALLIGHRQPAQHHRAIERPVDSADLDLEPAFELELLDLVGNEAVAGAGVEQEYAEREQRCEADDKADRPFGDGQRPVARLANHDDFRLGLGRIGFGGLGHRSFLARHQNACPIET